MRSNREGSGHLYFYSLFPICWVSASPARLSDFRFCCNVPGPSTRFSSIVPSDKEKRDRMALSCGLGRWRPVYWIDGDVSLDLFVLTRSSRSWLHPCPHRAKNAFNRPASVERQALGISGRCPVLLRVRSEDGSSSLLLSPIHRAHLVCRRGGCSDAQTTYLATMIEVLQSQAGTPEGCGKAFCQRLGTST